MGHKPKLRVPCTHCKNPHGPIWTAKHQPILVGGAIARDPSSHHGDAPRSRSHDSGGGQLPPAVLDSDEAGGPGPRNRVKKITSLSMCSRLVVPACGGSVRSAAARLFTPRHGPTTILAVSLPTEIACSRYCDCRIVTARDLSHPFSQ